MGILSPSILFNSVMQRLSGTDIREYDEFMEGVKRHWHKYCYKAILVKHKGTSKT
ncbi:MAG: DUF3526 domain-containing protein [Phycisphaerae bacterium]